MKPNLGRSIALRACLAVLTCGGWLLANDSPAAAGESCAGEVFTQVAAGGTHACGIRSDGSIFCWGRNLVSVLPPDGQATPPAGTFMQVAASVADDSALNVGTGEWPIGLSGKPNSTDAQRVLAENFVSALRKDRAALAACAGGASAIMEVWMS